MRAIWSLFGYKCYSKNTMLYRQTVQTSKVEAFLRND